MTVQLIGFQILNERFPVVSFAMPQTVIGSNKVDTATTTVTKYDLGAN